MIPISFFVIVSMTLVACLSVADSTTTINKSDVNRAPCFSDRDCPENDYCTSKGLCVPCFSCEKIHHQNSIKRCAREAKNCGPCLPGYAKSSHSDNHRRKVCIPVVTLAQPMTAENPDDASVNTTLAIGLAAIGFLVMTAFASWQCYRKKHSAPVITDEWTEMGLGPRSRCGNTVNGESSPPPGYEDCQISENGSVAYSFKLRITEHPESKTTAIPFQLPFGERIISVTSPNHENSNATNNTGNNSNSTDESVPEINYPTPTVDIHDELTQPCMWTPGDSYQMTQNIDETDGLAKEEKVSPPNKRRKTEGEVETPKNDS